MAAMEAAELVLDRMSLSNGGKGGLLVNTASLAGVADGLTKIFSTLIFFPKVYNLLYLGIVPGWVRDTHSYFASKHAVVIMILMMMMIKWYMLSSYTTNAIMQGHPCGPE